MTIKEIAKLANVSPSTVSKIINQKDGHISEETRRRVLEIVAHYQYSPLAKAMERSANPSRLIGAITPSVVDSYYANIIRSLEKGLAARGYNLILCNTDSEAEAEANAFRLLRARRVECIVIMGEARNAELIETVVQSGIPYIILNPENGISKSIKISFNHQQAISTLMQCFSRNNHRKVALVIPAGEKYFKQHYRHEMEQFGKVFDESMVFEALPDLSNLPMVLDTLLKTGARAILAGNMRIAGELYQCASLRHLRVGRDFSLAAFDDQDLAQTMVPPLTCVKFPFDEYAQTIVRIAIDLIEKRRVGRGPHMVDTVFYPGGSVTKNDEDQKPHIAVIGAINMDIMLEVSHLPNAAETITIRDKMLLPGGKGANQAVGAAKLGAKVSMIGRLGNDLYGKELYHHLHSANINVSGIIFDSEQPTGLAYIYVTDQAEYSIGIHGGANRKLDRKQIDSFIEDIQSASYCLVQTEIPMDTVEYLGQICAKNHVRMILKPSPAHPLSDELLSNLFMLVPNELEISELVPGDTSLMEKVDILLKRGTPRVILTLGETGCYYADAQTAHSFKPAPVNVVDTTGASDAFISALAVYLAEGSSMEQAIDFANIAAGISISQIGVQSALADRSAVEMQYKRESRS